MCTPDEKLILDAYVEGDFATGDLIELIQKQSKILDYEVYRGISIPSFLLKKGSNINNYYGKKVMSFTKNLNIAKEFSKKLTIDDRIFHFLKKDGYNIDYISELPDDVFFSKVIIRIKCLQSYDIYENYQNRRYEREQEVLAITEPLYIQSVTIEGDLIIVDCINEIEISKSVYI